MWPGMYLFVGFGVSYGARWSGCLVGKEGGGLMGWTYPSSVRQMLIRTSAPQPATMTTPTGGTGMTVSKASFEVLSGLQEGVAHRRG